MLWVLHKVLDIKDKLLCTSNVMPLFPCVMLILSILILMYVIKEVTVTACPQVIVGSHKLKCGDERLSNFCDFSPGSM